MPCHAVRPRLHCLIVLLCLLAKDKSERCGSSSGDAALERQPSLLSLAPSETSRSDLTTRQGRDPEKSFVIQSKNYYKQVSENKEISKLTSLLSTAINSTKKVRHIQKAVCIMYQYIFYDAGLKGYPRLLVHFIQYKLEEIFIITQNLLLCNTLSFH